MLTMTTDDFTPADVNFLADVLHEAFYNAPCDKGNCPTCSHAKACKVLYQLEQYWSHKADEVNYKAAESDHV